jgi:hypothetical protein
VEAFGFATERVERNSWRGTFNFELFGTKQKMMDRAGCERAARAYLREFLVDESPSELRLLDAWMNLYSSQVERSWARAGYRLGNHPYLESCTHDPAGH